MCERTIAEYEEELCPTNEGKERQHQLLDAYYRKHHQIVSQTDVQQPPHIKEEYLHPPCVKEEEAEPSHIKEEEEEVWSSQEGECPLGQEETDLTVKTEDHENKPPKSSQRHHSPKISGQFIK
ncbi:uncharacterized protein [Nerophis lumbriciformis]|uniref:uncharacterized protein isoform X2 n=1 Tax=Nerophis lumbriciformis TaxID=546530 RepID=UPI003BAAB95B